MGDFMRMDPGGVGELMGRLGDAGHDLHADWQTVLGAIAGGERFGGDAIAEAVRGAYQPAGDALRDLAARLPAAVTSMAAAGTRSAALYHAAEQDGAAAMGAVAGAQSGGAGPDARA